jgi:hypothetical protein
MRHKPAYHKRTQATDIFNDANAVKSMKFSCNSFHERMEKLQNVQLEIDPDV